MSKSYKTAMLLMKLLKILARDKKILFPFPSEVLLPTLFDFAEVIFDEKTYTVNNRLI